MNKWYGGTKTEMERLLKDAQAITGVKYDINNLADVYSAIHAIQEQLGITGTTMKEAETTITGSLGMVKASWQNLLTAMSGGGDLDRAINNFVYSLEKFTANIAPVIERTLLGLGQAIQRTLPMLVQTVVSALVQQIPNLVISIYHMIVGLFKGIVSGIKALFTGGTAKATEVIKGNVSGISSNASLASDNMNNLADATEKAGKQAKKSLAAFDDLNILSSGANDETEAGTVNTSGTSMPTGLENVTPTTQSGGGMSGLTPEIKENLEALLPIIEIALVAIGLILLAMGNIPWGIGFIIAGAYLYSVTARSEEGEFDLEVIKEDLKKLAEYIEEILIVFGIILLFLGQIGWGIAFIIAGAAVFAIKELKQGKYNEADIVTKLAIIMEAVSLALIGIGVMLIFFGHVPLGLGFIFVGKKLLDISEQKLEEGGVTTKLKKFMQDNSGIIVGVGLALVIIGLICFCFGLLNPITFGIFMAGAAVLAAEETMNPGAIKEEITKFFQDNKGLIVGVSIALIVLGVILLFTGVGIPLAIGLIVAGGGALAAEVALNWNFIVDKVKEVWQKVKDFWNEHIAPVFTAEWWKNLGKKAMNGLIAGFEAGINGIIGMFEKMINWIVNGLNKISFDVPEWVPGIGGKTFGFDIPEVKFNRVSIPRLAQGAVIPPNREFLAVLGDQKQGTNIEAPLQTIVDAFNIALAQNGGTVGNTEVILEIDGREFGRAVVEQGDRENRRIGTKLVVI